MSAGSELGFPIKGSLKRTPFPSLVKQIADARAEGSLYLLSGKTKKVVFFEEGQPVFVRSNVLSECLGQILAREGLITEEQCEQTLEAIRRTGKKQGELLVEMGILSEGNLRYGLEAQLRHKLFDIFGWEEGRFQFKPGKGNQAFGMRVDGGAEGIIVSAILDTHSEKRARGLLGDALDKYPKRDPSQSTEGLELMPSEAHLLDCLDGSRTVAEVLDDESITAPTPSALLYALVSVGLATLNDEASPAAERPPEPVDEARDRPDEDFFPDYEPTNAIKSYEDTPLPGALPERDQEMPDEDEEMFGGLERPEAQPVEREVSEDLLAAESEDMVDETFEDDDIELLDADELEIVEELEEIDDIEEDAGEDLEALADALEPDDDLVMADDAPAAAEEALADLEPDDDLMDLDELDDIDLGDDLEEEPAKAPAAKATRADDVEEDPEVVGAMRFSEGEMALQSHEWDQAVELLESAYEHGIDVAELHAMLAYARFKTAEDDPEMQTHALELLDYATELNPNLDIVFAYRGDVLAAQGDADGARGALQQALDINPYCDVALELMDRIG
jgi:tetratricopeptide (TPR) repeat protein